MVSSVDCARACCILMNVVYCTSKFSAAVLVLLLSPEVRNESSVLWDWECEFSFMMLWGGFGDEGERGGSRG